MCVSATHVARALVTLIAAERSYNLISVMNFLSSLVLEMFGAVLFYFGAKYYFLFLLETQININCICCFFKRNKFYGFISSSLAQTDRLNFFNLTGDVTTRVDTLSAWTGQLFVSIGILGCQQNLVQRYLSMSSVKEIRK